MCGIHKGWERSSDSTDRAGHVKGTYWELAAAQDDTEMRLGGGRQEVGQAETRTVSLVSRFIGKVLSKGMTTLDFLF